MQQEGENATVVVAIFKREGGRGSGRSDSGSYLREKYFELIINMTFFKLLLLLAFGMRANFSYFTRTEGS